MRLFGRESGLKGFFDYLFSGGWNRLRVLHLCLHPHFLPQDPPGHAGAADTQSHSQGRNKEGIMCVMIGNKASHSITNYGRQIGSFDPPLSLGADYSQHNVLDSRQTWNQSS